MKNRLSHLLLAAFLAAGTASAQEASGEDLYLKAMQAISEGRQADAGLSLERMIEMGPQNAGEWLDLAMVHCALGHAREAAALFDSIEQRFAPERGVLGLIEQQRAQGCQPVQPLRQWALSLARGHDSNVNQGASNPYYSIGGTPIQLLPEYQPRGDGYTALSADFLSNLGNNGDTAFVQAHLRQQDHLSAYNTISLFAGLDHPWRYGRWRWRSTAQLGLLTLGGQLYQEQVQLLVRATPPLQLPDKLDFHVQGSLARTDYKTLSNFNSSTVELRSVLGYRDVALQGQLSMALQYDQGPLARPGGDRSGWNLRAFVHSDLGDKLQGELDLSRQNWDGKNNYSPGLIDLHRNQATLAWRATLIYPLSRSQTLQLEWGQVHNRESISIFQYDSHQLQLTWKYYDW